MNKPKFEITLQNENQFHEKKLIGTPLHYNTVSRHYNRLSGYQSCGHDFKCNDTFKVDDPRILLVSFFGSEIRFILYHDGTLKESDEYVGKNLFGEYHLIRDEVN